MSEEELNQELSTDDLKDVAGGIRVGGNAKNKRRMKIDNKDFTDESVIPKGGFGTFLGGDIDGKPLSEEESRWDETKNQK
ncbi:hypothetical protein [Prochlorococcus marinus]|uniref:hypothetical protein n=1 Tax=Prochlorococcus marinus TaxID=1219 RepID=UPI0022B4C942|nr:hypothetical protein [Prochlorococcus marinus]